jgi:pilus assembly protein Flp/PilA
MLKKLMAFREAYLRDESAATAIEYGLIAAGVAVAISVVIFTFGSDLTDLITDMSTKVKERPS